MKKIERLMAIILLLRCKGKLTAEDIAKKLEFSKRTIYRDMQALLEMGVPIVSNTSYDGGYELQDDYFISPIQFNKEEIVALLLSEMAINNINIPGFKGVLQTAFNKIKAVSNSVISDAVDEISQRVIFDIRYYYPKVKNKDIISNILNSIMQCTQLKISCNNSKILANPYGLVFNHGDWELIYQTEAYFKRLDINKIDSIEFLSDNFNADVTFSIEDYYYCKNYSKSKTKCDEYVTVRLMMDINLFERLKNEVHFVDAKVNYNDNTVELQIDTTNEYVYIDFAMRYPEKFQVLEPIELIGEISQRLRKLNKIYNIN